MAYVARRSSMHGQCGEKRRQRRTRAVYILSLVIAAMYSMVVDSNTFEEGNHNRGWEIDVDDTLFFDMYELDSIPSSVSMSRRLNGESSIPDEAIDLFGGIDAFQTLVELIQQYETQQDERGVPLSCVQACPVGTCDDEDDGDLPGCVDCSTCMDNAMNTFQTEMIDLLPDFLVTAILHFADSSGSGDSYDSYDSFVENSDQYDAFLSLFQGLSGDDTTLDSIMTIVMSLFDGMNEISEGSFDSYSSYVGSTETPIMSTTAASGAGSFDSYDSYDSFDDDDGMATTTENVVLTTIVATEPSSPTITLCSARLELGQLSKEDVRTFFTAMQSSALEDLDDEYVGNVESTTFVSVDASFLLTVQNGGSAIEAREGLGTAFCAGLDDSSEREVSSGNVEISCLERDVQIFVSDDEDRRRLRRALSGDDPGCGSDNASIALRVNLTAYGEVDEVVENNPQVFNISSIVSSIGTVCDFDGSVEGNLVLTAVLNSTLSQSELETFALQVNIDDVVADGALAANISIDDITVSNTFEATTLTTTAAPATDDESWLEENLEIVVGVSAAICAILVIAVLCFLRGRLRKSSKISFENRKPVILGAVVPPHLTTATVLPTDKTSSPLPSRIAGRLDDGDLGSSSLPRPRLREEQSTQRIGVATPRKGKERRRDGDSDASMPHRFTVEEESSIISSARGLPIGLSSSQMALRSNATHMHRGLRRRLADSRNSEPTSSATALATDFVAGSNTEPSSHITRSPYFSSSPFREDFAALPPPASKMRTNPSRTNDSRCFSRRADSECERTEREHRRQLRRRAAVLRSIRKQKRRGRRKHSPSHRRHRDGHRRRAVV